MTAGAETGDGSARPLARTKKMHVNAAIPATPSSRIRVAPDHKRRYHRRRASLSGATARKNLSRFTGSPIRPAMVSTQGWNSGPFLRSAMLRKGSAPTMKLP